MSKRSLKRFLQVKNSCRLCRCLRTSRIRLVRACGIRLFWGGLSTILIACSSQSVSADPLEHLWGTVIDYDGDTYNIYIYSDDSTPIGEQLSESSHGSIVQAISVRRADGYVETSTERALSIVGVYQDYLFMRSFDYLSLENMAVRPDEFGSSGVAEVDAGNRFRFRLPYSPEQDSQSNILLNTVSGLGNASVRRRIWKEIFYNSFSHRPIHGAVDELDISQSGSPLYPNRYPQWETLCAEESAVLGEIANEAEGIAEVAGWLNSGVNSFIVAEITSLDRGWISVSDLSAIIELKKAKAALKGVKPFLNRVQAVLPFISLGTSISTDVFGGFTNHALAQGTATQRADAFLSLLAYADVNGLLDDTEILNGYWEARTEFLADQDSISSAIVSELSNGSLSNYSTYSDLLAIVIQQKWVAQQVHWMKHLAGKMSVGWFAAYAYINLVFDAVDEWDTMRHGATALMLQEYLRYTLHERVASLSACDGEVVANLREVHTSMYFNGFYYFDNIKRVTTGHWYRPLDWIQAFLDWFSDVDGAEAAADLGIQRVLNEYAAFAAPQFALTGQVEWIRSLLEAGQDRVAPIVVITSPSDGTEVLGSVSLSADACDDLAVGEVEFSRSAGGESWVPIATDFDGSDGWSVNTFDVSSIPGIADGDKVWFQAIGSDTASPPNLSLPDATWVVFRMNPPFPEPGLGVEPSELRFDNVVDGRTVRLSYVVTNTGTATMSWQASTSTTWISDLSLESWILQPGESRTIVVTANTNASGIVAGRTYSGSIVNEAASYPEGTPLPSQTINVSLEVIPDPGGPGTTTRNPVADVHISQDNPAATYDHADLDCRKFSGFDNAGLIKFDLADLDDGNHVVLDATLELYCNYYNNDGADSQDLRIYESTSNWDELTATWATNGLHYSAAYSNSVIDVDGAGWTEEIDVTQLVRRWLSWDNRGLYIGWPQPSDGTKIITFHSSENSNPPTLRISYKTKDGTPPLLSINQPNGGQVFNTPNVTVSGTAYDANGLDVVLVRVNGSGTWTTATGLENWSTSVTLVEGENLIEVRARDTTTEDIVRSVSVEYAAPDYSLTCYPPSIVLKQGRLGNISTFLAGKNGYSDPVTLSVADLPSGAQVVIQDNPVTPTDATNIALDVTTNAVIGTYPLSVNGTGGKSYPVTLVVQDGVPPQVQIDTPTEEATYEADTRTIAISGTASDAGAGVLLVTIDSGQANTGTLEEWSFDVTLDDGWNVLQVTVIDRNGNQDGDLIAVKYSPPLPGMVTNPEPVDEAVDVPVNQPLSWGEAPNATSYDVYLGVSSNGVAQATPATSGVYRGNCTSASFSPGVLASTSTYYWRIDSRNVSGIAGGEVWEFVTSGPILVGDVNGDLLVDLFDLVLVSASFGREVADGDTPMWDAMGDGSTADSADVNGDGAVDLFDLVIVSSHFGDQV